MTIATPLYSAATALTCTVAGLVNATYRQSLVVDNTTNKYLNVLLSGCIQAGTTPTLGNLITIYAYADLNGTLYTAGATGTDVAFTADGQEVLLRTVTSIRVNATTDRQYNFGPISLAPVFGGDMPKKWGIVVLNGSGTTLNATGTPNFFSYTGIKYESL